MSASIFAELNSGSRWHRWEPHVHAPGTVLNDQFTGEDAWGRYFKAIEDASPAIRALGITDYSYISGGLESTHIRQAVCETLEGGEPAFRERARRLRVRLDR
jgi:hypothetical protein